MEAEKKLQADSIIINNKVVVTKCYVPSFCKRLIDRSYMDPKEKSLDPLEAALWLSRGQLGIERKTGWTIALNLISIFKIPLKIFITYLIHRRRYPKVYQWTRRDTLVAYGLEKQNKKIEVLVLEEGEEVLIEDIVNWSIAASKDDHEPLIAIVDRNGSVTFYEARAVSRLT